MDENLQKNCQLKLDSNVMGQHYILTYGDNTEVLKDICKLLDITII